MQAETPKVVLLRMLKPDQPHAVPVADILTTRMPTDVPVERLNNRALMTRLAADIAEAQRRRSLTAELRTLLRDVLHEIQLEDLARRPGGIKLIEVLHPEIATAQPEAEV